MLCAIGTRASPQKNSNTDAPPVAPRAMCRAKTARTGQRPPGENSTP